MIASLLAGASHAQDPHAGHSHAGHSHGESAAETAQAPIAYPPDAVLYEASGKKHTVAEFVESVRLFPPGPLGALDIADFDLSKATPDAVKEAVEQTAVQAEAARRAREAGLEMEDARDDRMHRDLEMIEQRIWLFETGILGDTDVTDEQVRAQYDADAARSYTTPEQLAMRHIFLSTYEEYLVQAGDSLESIAEKITGDRSAADRILNAERF